MSNYKTTPGMQINKVEMPLREIAVVLQQKIGWPPIYDEMGNERSDAALAMDILRVERRALEKLRKIVEIDCREK